MKELLIVNFIIPFVMLLVGTLLKIMKPNPKIGFNNGYSTPSSRKSQERWDYAQVIAPPIFIKMGNILLWVMVLLNAVFLFSNYNNQVSVSICITIGFLFVIMSFYKVEKKLKIKFGDYNK